MEILTKSEHALNTDARPNQERQHENPIEKNRRQTDKCFMFVVFLPILVLWLAIGISRFFAVRKEDKREGSEVSSKILSYINAPVTKLSVTLPVSLFICTAVICFCLFLYERFTKALIYISCMTIIFVTISSCFNFVRPTPSITDDSKMRDIKRIIKEHSIAVCLALVYVLIMYSLPNFIYTVTSAFSFFKVDIKILCDLTKYSCQLILRTPSLLLFTVLITTVRFLVISFTLNALVFDLFSDRSELLLYIYFIVILIGGIYVANFIVNFARMVISEYTVNAVWMKDEKTSIAPIAMNVFRNHMGTAMFASTMIVSFISSIIQALKHKPSWRIKEHYIYYIVTKVALVTTPDTALIFSSIYGTGFLKSYKITFDTVLRRSTTYLAMLLVIDGVFVIILCALIVPVAVMVAANATMNYSITPDLSRVIYGVLYSYLAFELLITSTMKAQLINIIIILNKEEGGHYRRDAP